MHCRSAVKVSPFFGTAGRHARTGFLSTISTSQRECSTYYGRPTLPSTHSVRVLFDLLTRNQSVGPAFYDELTKEGELTRTSSIFRKRHAAHIARTVHLGKRPNSWRYSFCSNSSSSGSVSGGEWRFPENTEHSDAKLYFSTNCSSLFAGSTARISSPYSQEPACSENASFNSGTASAVQLFPNQLSKWRESNPCPHYSGGSLFASSWNSTSSCATSTQRQQSSAYLQCTLGNTYRSATAPVCSSPDSQEPCSENASFNSGTASAVQLFPNQLSKWEESNPCPHYSGGSLSASSWNSTSSCATSTQRQQSSAYSQCTLGNTYRSATAPVCGTPIRELFTHAGNKEELDGAQRSETLAASSTSSSSTFIFATPSDTKSVSEHQLVFTPLHCLRRSCCVSTVKKAWYSCMQACNISCTRKSPGSSFVHQKQEDPVSFFSCDTPENLSWNWWDMYIRGINPDYPPRQRMFAYLTSQGVCVKKMEIQEIEEFTKYLEMRRVYGDEFPVFPYNIKFEDKLEDLRQKYPVEPGKAKKAKKLHE